MTRGCDGRDLSGCADAERAGDFDLDTLNREAGVSVDNIKKMPTYHAIILATSEVGRVNLYHLISESHINYYHRRPRVPKSVYLKFKEGLLIGSACEAGELYQALLRGAAETEIARLVKFYDYLEIQPLGNNALCCGRTGMILRRRKI
mgnify:CR=1 FL=1